MPITLKKPTHLSLNNKSGYRSSSAMLLACSVLGLGAPQAAHADCTTTGNTVTCVGDVSAGSPVILSPVDTIIIENTTTVFGGSELVLSTTAPSVTVDADFGVLGFESDPTGTAQVSNQGINLNVFSGDIDVGLSGPITINAGEDQTINNDDRFVLVRDHRNGLSVFADNIAIEQNGNLTVNNADVDASGKFNSGIDVDLFYGVDLRASGTDDALGDIDLTRVGDLTLNGGDLDARTTDGEGSNRALVGGTTGTASNVLGGIYLQATGDVTVSNTGNLTVSSGSRSVTADSGPGGRAEALSDTTSVYGISLTRSATGIASLLNTIDDIPESVTLSQIGDVSVTIEDSVLSATSQTAPGGEVSEAYIDDIALGTSSAGIRLENGRNLTADISGDVEINGGTIFGTANALDGGEDTQGHATAFIFTQNVTGITAFSPRGDDRDVEFDESADIRVSGDVTANGVSVDLNIAATGQALNRSVEFPPSSTSTQTNSVAGGRAVAVNVRGFNDETFIPSTETSTGVVTERVSNIDLALDGIYVANGGNVAARITGSDTTGDLRGGSALAVQLDSLGARLDVSDLTQLRAVGGDVNLTFEGSHGLYFTAGGNAFGVAGDLQSDTDLTWGTGVEVVAIGGNAITSGDFEVGQNSAAEMGSLNGGQATGLIVGLRSTLTRTEEENLSPEALAELQSRELILDGDIVATGGDAAADTVEAFGGGAVGIDASGATNYTVTGNVTAIGGNGTAFDGAAVGINQNVGVFPGLLPLDVPSATIRIAGNVDVSGQGVDIADSYVSRVANIVNTTHTASSGVLVAGSGFQEVIVQNGGTVRSEGDFVHGAVLAAERGALTVESGALIEATGTNASGIEVRPLQDFEFATAGIPAVSAITEIVIEQGGRVISQQGTGILDDERRAAIDTSSGRPFSTIVDTAANATTVDVAGTLSGGNGVAIDLGTGDDQVTLRQTSETTGDILLGDGNDTLRLEDGFTLTGGINGGNGADGILVDIAAGLSQTLDLNGASISGFELLTKDGDGALTLSGSTIAEPLFIEALGGLTTVLTHQPNVSVEVSQASLVSETTLGTVFNSGELGVGSTLTGTRGTLALTGDLFLGNRGTLHVDIQAPDQSDLITVQDTTNLDGTLAVNALGVLTTFVPGQEYTIIESEGAVTGSFATIIDNLPDLDIAQSTVENWTGGGHVVLSLTSEGPVVPTDPTDPMDPTPPTDPTDPTDPIDPISPPTSGDFSDKSVHSNSTQAATGAGAAFSGILLDAAGGNAINPVPVGVSRDGNDGLSFSQAFGAPENYVWLTPFGARSDVDATAAATGYTSTTGGIGLGFEQRRVIAAGDLTWGVAIATLDSSVDSAASNSDVETNAVGVYGSLKFGDLTVSGEVSYGRQDHETSRVIPVAGANVVATSQADGSFTSVSGKLSYDLTSKVGWKEASVFAPFVKFTHTRSRRDGFVETGAGALNLTVNSDSFSRNALSIGAETATQFETRNGAIMRAYADIGIEHVFGDLNTVTASSIAGVNGANFLSPGAAESRNRLNVGLGLDMAISENINANVSYSGSFSDNFTDHKASISFAMRF